MLKQRSRQRGVTLIELLIVVVMIGILTMIAVPTYQQSVMKSRRADARVALNTLAQRLERCYTQFGAYDSPDCDIANGFASPDGFYEVSFESTPTTYTVTAEPQGTQAEDSGCGSFSMTSTGVRTIDTDGDDAPDEDEHHCW